MKRGFGFLAGLALLGAAGLWWWGQSIRVASPRSLRPTQLEILALGRDYPDNAEALLQRACPSLRTFKGPALAGWRLPPVAAVKGLARWEYFRAVTGPARLRGEEASLEAFHRAILKENPVHAGAKLDLGRLLRERGNAKVALEWHRSAREDNTVDPWPLWEMLLDLDAQGEKLQARHGADLLEKEAASLSLPMLAAFASYLQRVGDEPRLARVRQRAGAIACP